MQPTTESGMFDVEADTIVMQSNQSQVSPNICGHILVLVLYVAVKQ